MIVLKTSLKEMPANCLECPIVGCALPLLHTRNSRTDMVKIKYRNQRHEDCPLLMIEEALEEL